MKEQVRVGISVGREQTRDWREMVKNLFKPLEPISVKEYPFGYDFVFDYYPLQIKDIEDQLRLFQIHSIVTVNRSYSKRELLQADFLMLNYTGVVYSTKRNPLYQAEQRLICPHCGFQMVTWNLRGTEVMGKDHRYKLAALDWHPTVVSHDLAVELEKAGFSGLTLMSVGRKTPPEWYGLYSNGILPPLQIPPTRLIFGIGMTPDCESNHMIEEWRSEFCYQRTGFNALDFNSTYEVFGDRSGGVRMTIISRRVYQLLVKLGVKRLRCEPVRFID